LARPRSKPGDQEMYANADHSARGGLKLRGASASGIRYSAILDHSRSRVPIRCLFLRNLLVKRFRFATSFAATSAFVAATSLQLPAFANNLVTNGSFENSTTNAGRPDTGGIGHIDKIVNLPGWLKTCINQCGNGPVTEANSHG
jgi:hypothetical protein